MFGSCTELDRGNETHHPVTCSNKANPNMNVQDVLRILAKGRMNPQWIIVQTCGLSEGVNLPETFRTRT